MSTVTVTVPVPTPRFGMLSVVATIVTEPSGRVTAVSVALPFMSSGAGDVPIIVPPT